MLILRDLISKPCAFNRIFTSLKADHNKGLSVWWERWWGCGEGEEESVRGWSHRWCGPRGKHDKGMPQFFCLQYHP